jgi:hypothetical protein
MFSLMFYGFLRIREVTLSPNNLQTHSVVLSRDGVTITFLSFKHHVGKPFTFVVRPTSTPCPVTLFQDYRRVRGHKLGRYMC